MADSDYKTTRLRCRAIRAIAFTPVSTGDVTPQRYR
jgi:hypothetical protein